MDARKLISDILQGETCVVNFGSAVLGVDKDAIPSVISLLNLARLVFTMERTTPALSNILASLCSGQMIENAFAIRREWRKGAYSGVEEAYHLPLFENSLKLVLTDVRSPNPDHVAALLENLYAGRSSVALLITCYSDVAMCLRLHAHAQDIYILFHERQASKHEPLATLTFSKSLAAISQRLCHSFPLEKPRPSLENPGGKCTGYLFHPKATEDSVQGEESLIVPSLTLLTLRADLEELKRQNGDLKRRQQQLHTDIANIEAELREEQAKTRRAVSFGSSTAHTVHSSSFSVGRGGPPTRSVISTTKRRGTLAREDVNDVDLSMKFALQLQATFDSENEFLLQQKQELAKTAQRRYHCGVCLDDVPEDDVIRIDSCGHEICRDCARGHACTKIEERRFPVLCPVCSADPKNKNPGAMSGLLVQLLGVTEKQWETWIEMELAQFSILINCRKCHHTGFVDREDLDSSAEIRCPFAKCDHVWCKRCQQTIPEGGPKHSCDGTSELDHLMKQQGWRYCPNCKTPIQKTQGCNHLHCTAPGCNSHFCYGCGRVMRGYNNPGHVTTQFCTC